MVKVKVTHKCSGISKIVSNRELDDYDARIYDFEVVTKSKRPIARLMIGGKLKQIYSMRELDGIRIGGGGNLYDENELPRMEKQWNKMLNKGQTLLGTRCSKKGSGIPLYVEEFKD